MPLRFDNAPNDLIVSFSFCVRAGYDRGWGVVIHWCFGSMWRHTLTLVGPLYKGIWWTLADSDIARSDWGSEQHWLVRRLRTRWHGPRRCHQGQYFARGINHGFISAPSFNTYIWLHHDQCIVVRPGLEVTYVNVPPCVLACQPSQKPRQSMLASPKNDTLWIAVFPPRYICGPWDYFVDS